MSEDKSPAKQETAPGWKDPALAQRWIDAAIILGNNPDANVLCPECGHANLEVIDAPTGDRLDRYLSCPSCKRYNVMSNVVVGAKKSSQSGG